MDLLVGYNSDDSEEKPLAQRPNKDFLNAAPAVSKVIESSAMVVRDKGPAPLKRKHGDVILYNNPKKSVLYQPVQGPVDPTSAVKGTGGTMEANVAFDEAAFKNQRSEFQRTGQAIGPGDSGEVVQRTTLGYDSQRLEKFAEIEEKRRKKPRPDRKEKPILVAGSDDEAEYGIWGPPSKEEQYEVENAKTDIQKHGVEGLLPGQLEERAYLAERARLRGLAEEKEEDETFVDRLVERKMAHLLPPKVSSEAIEASTIFHGDEEMDYKGRSWISPPAGLGNVVAGGKLEMDHHKCYVPKKCVHRFTGHDKGIQRIRLFPKTGHLILSAGLDGKCMVWSVAQKKLMRTYVGHSAAVRDVQFNLDGTKFLSASFDRYVRLWNTETGEVLQTFSNRKVPYVVKFYPQDDNIFVVGCSDSRIVAYDATTAEITQEYNHHLGPVNSILFVEDHGTKMVTTSDDKKVLVWEWDIGVPIKYISDPSMHSIPATALHPSLQYFCGQSLDNTIVVLQANDKFSMQRKKKFSGHIVSGYACEPTVSPDGRYLVSGDGNGAVFIWDWKRHRIMQKFRAHTSGPAICTIWHPVQESTVFSCGWDGVIKMWQ